MDLTIPYTFYPIALPHWIAWVLFGVAVTGGIVAGARRGRTRGWLSGLVAGVVSTAGFLIVTMLASMVITFFVHDI
jgi:hypothetical protein